jgi:hypothetical protein
MILIENKRLHINYAIKSIVRPGRYASSIVRALGFADVTGDWLTRNNKKRSILRRFGSGFQECGNRQRREVAIGYRFRGDRQ